MSPSLSSWRRRFAGLRLDVTPLRTSGDFRILWAAGTVFYLGAMITYVAMPFQLYQLTGSNFAVEVGLGEELIRAGRRADELKTVPLKQEWKLTLAETLRAKTGASISWLARNLYLGGPATLRGYMHLRKEVNSEGN